MAKAFNFAVLAEFSLLEFQTKETCTLPEMREFPSTPSKNNHKPLIQYIMYKPFLYLSGIGREVSCVVTAICTMSSTLVNKEHQKKNFIEPSHEPKCFLWKLICFTHLNIPQVTSALIFIVWFNIQLNYPWMKYPNEKKE